MNKEIVKYALLVFVAKLIYRFMPYGYYLEVWRWPDTGNGNAVIWPVPTPVERYNNYDKAVWEMNRNK